MSRALSSVSPAGAALDQRLALDVQGVGDLRRAARSSPDEALRQVSKQFEALFMGMVLKSMRDTVPASGLTDGQNGKFYQSMLDQQLAQHLSGRGMKLADAMYAQLRRTLPAGQQGPEAERGDSSRAPAAASAAAPSRHVTTTPIATARSLPAASATAQASGGAGPADAALPSAVTLFRAVPVSLPPLRAHSLPAASIPRSPPQTEPVPGGIPARVQRFVEHLGEAARAAAAATGLPERLILAQAALESAWGRREVRADDGTTAFNLFGIKADRSWRGPVTEATTTEVVNGVAHRVRAKFRAYGSYQEAFADYAKFLTGNRRYGAVVGETDATRAAHELQRAGYATDPDYARKLIRVMKRLVD